jgi:hypothetical protein
VSQGIYRQASRHEMFTFGREHEKKCASTHVDDPSQIPNIHRVIDAVHDLLDGVAAEHEIAPVLADTFVNGGSGVWEQTGSWLAKLCPKYPTLSSLWLEFAGNRSASIRFRAAAFICNMPEQEFQVLLPQLLRDKSSRVRSKVAGDLWVSPRQGAEPYLAEQLGKETDSKVREALTFALDAAHQQKR